MPDKNVVPLHMGKCLNDLKPHLDCGKTIKGTKIELLCRTVTKLLDEAQKSLREGDEEKSYVLYMRYMETMLYIQSTDDYKKKKVTLKNAKCSLKDCIDIAEKLSKSLEERYKALEKQEKAKIEPKGIEKGIIDELSKETAKPDSTKHKQEVVLNGYPDSKITSHQLYDLLRNERSNILVFDVRPSTSFVASQIHLGSCVANIPDEIVHPGLSAAALEKSLPPRSKSLWEKRGTVDLIVLMDWKSKSTTLTSDNKLHILKGIMLNWDPNTQYRHEPVILEGGYEDWVLKFPMYTTNSKISAPTIFDNSDLITLLEGIDYPDLNDNVPNNLSALPKVDRSSKPILNSSSGSSSKAVGVNIITDINSSSNISTSVKNPVQADYSEPTTISMHPDKPVVDRASKAAALQLYLERSRDVENLEKNRLKVEKEWEELRLRREKETEEELRSFLQQQEEELLRNIINLKKEQNEKELENQELRKELDAYKKKEQEESRFRNEKEGNKNIGLIEEEKISLQNEKMEQERLNLEKKLKEQKKHDEEASIKEKEHQEKDKQEKETAKIDRQTTQKDVYYTTLKTDNTAGSSTMKRSHSSPNIAQLDESDWNMRAPHFDRANKPTFQSRVPEMHFTTRQRNLNPVYGMVGRGLTGLKNLGNTCYMNSVLQCLSNTLPLTKYFVDGTYHNDINKQSHTRGQVVEEVAVVVRSLWAGEYRSIACYDLKAVVGHYREQFRTSQQQDSNEFLTVLMEWLHEDLKLKSEIKLKVSNEENLPESRKQFMEFYNKNRSIIVKLFYGQQLSTVRCLRCGKESKTYETFSNLTLPLPSNGNRCTLDECIRLYLEGERVSGWTCPSCKEQRDAMKKFDILRLPPILIIHFKRFYVDGWCRKRQTFVDFPLTDLNMKNYTTMLDYQQYRPTYNLYGVSNHYGTMEGGHYTAYCKNSVQNKWFKFDDHEVSEISPSDVKTGAAYILFYASEQCENLRVS